jgi:hypothetical protein
MPVSPSRFNGTVGLRCGMRLSTSNLDCRPIAGAFEPRLCTSDVVACVRITAVTDEVLSLTSRRSTLARAALSLRLIKVQRGVEVLNLR